MEGESNQKELEEIINFLNPRLEEDLSKIDLTLYPDPHEVLEELLMSAMFHLSPGHQPLPLDNQETIKQAILSILLQNSNTKFLDNREREGFRDRLINRIHHEDTLLGSRLTWFLFFSGFLFSFYGQLYGIKSNLAKSKTIETQISEVYGSIENFTGINEATASAVDQLKTSVKSTLDTNNTPEKINTLLPNLNDQIGIFANLNTQAQNLLTDLQTNIQNLFGSFQRIQDVEKGVIWVGVLTSIAMFFLVLKHLGSNEIRWRNFGKVSSKLYIDGETSILERGNLGGIFLGILVWLLLPLIPIIITSFWVFLYGQTFLIFNWQDIAIFLLVIEAVFLFILYILYKGY